MSDTLYLAWRYVAYHRWKTLILVLAITLVVFLPAILNILVERSAQQLMARADATPLLIGSKGSPLELALNSLYFEGGTPAPMSYMDIDIIRESGLARPVPLYARFTASGYPIVGTTPDYFDFRKLHLAAGRQFVMLGEALVGSEVAHELGLEVGDAIVSSPESAFDLAGVYPLKMTVIGILAPSFSADDNAVFTDIKTTWVIEGLGHGHQDLEQKEAAAAVLKRDDKTIIANASLVQYNEITAENANSFHFHGDTSTYPINGIVVVPNDEKSGVIFQGRMQNTEGSLQIINPREVIDALLGTVFTVQQYVIAAVYGGWWCDRDAGHTRISVITKAAQARTTHTVQDRRIERRDRGRHGCRSIDGDGCQSDISRSAYRTDRCLRNGPDSCVSDDLKGSSKSLPPSARPGTPLHTELQEDEVPVRELAGNRSQSIVRVNVGLGFDRRVVNLDCS